MVIVLDDDLVIDIFGGDVHERPIERPLARQNVFSRNRIDVLLYVGDKLPPRRCPVSFVFQRNDALEIFKREFGIDTDRPAAERDKRIDRLPGLEHVLENVAIGREHLGKDIAEHRFAKSAADLRRLEDILKRCDILGYLENLLVCFIHFCQSLANIQKLLSCILKALIETGRIVVQPLIECGLHIVKLLEERR